MKMRLSGFVLFAVTMIFACGGNSPNVNPNTKVNNSNNGAANKTANNTTPTNAVQNYTYEIVKAYPHDGQAFTQGLVFHNGFFYEGTGGRKRDDYHSTLRKVEVETGKVLQKIDLAGEYFGEGITLFNDKIYQITWQEGTAFVYDANDFKMLKQFRYAGEGWGLTHDETNLIMSDGTHVIRFINPETFETVRTIVVNDEKGKPLMELNELEYVKGEIWANIWQEDEIARIDPTSGKLLGRINFTKMIDDELKDNRDGDVLNGIAYDAASDRLFVTGKKWKHVYEIKVKPKG